jgi:transketolase
MRDAFARGFCEAARLHQNLFLVVADISPAASLDDFRREFPTRLVDAGVSEQTMIGVAAGLALRGFRPFTYTIANFTIYRPFEQVRIDLCYQNLPVVLVGIGGGMSYSALGGTHHTIEDIAVMGCLPNMTILAPCDPPEVEVAVMAAAVQPGPVYLRVGKSGEPPITAQAEPFAFGKLRRIAEGDDAVIIGYGPILKLGVDAAQRWQKETGKRAAVYSAHTMKPFDHAGAKDLLRRYSKVITLEEHVSSGGLGALVKQAAQECGSRARISTLHLRDEFIHIYGSQDDLRAAHGITVDTVHQALTQ